MNKKLPIKRLNKFYSEEDYKLDIEMGMEALGDSNFTVILFRVDYDRTESDDLYGESPRNGISFYPPVEITVFPSISEAENKAYNENAGSLRYMQDGKLEFYVYETELQMRNVDIKYGDYIGYQIDEDRIKYFVVTNDGKINYDDEKTIMGYKHTYRKITCAIADENEFNG
jgi:hypothetical protein